MALTGEQLALLRTRRRLKPPSYFSAALVQTVQITQDTEDALILSPGQAKQKAVAYLRLLLDANIGSSDIDDLLEKFANKQAAVQTARNTELSNIIQKFSSFKDDLTQNNTDETFIEGYSPLLKAISKGLGPVKRNADLSEFTNLAASTALAFFGDRLTDDDERELRSWIRVLLAYP